MANTPRRGWTAALAALVAVAISGAVIRDATRPADQPVAATTTEQCTVADRGSLPSARRQAIYDRQHGLDWWTGLPLPATGWHVDHVLSWQWALCHGLNPADVRAFDRDPGNLVATAARVNLQKSDSVPWDGRWQPDIHACWWVHSVQLTIVRYQLTPGPDGDRGLARMMDGCAR